jgi:hypothetical protein
MGTHIISPNWGSHGSTNNELVDNLRNHGILQSHQLENAIRRVDVKEFLRHVQTDSVAYADQVCVDRVRGGVGGGGGCNAILFFNLPAFLLRNRKRHCHSTI